MFYSSYGNDINIIEAYCANKGIYFMEHYECEAAWREYSLSTGTHCSSWNEVNEKTLREFVIWAFNNFNSWHFEIRRLENE